MANTRTITSKSIKDFHQQIATAHKEINGFYRFDIAEINNSFRSGVGSPALLLEAPSSELYSKTQMVSNFNLRNISFLIIDHAGELDDYDQKDQVLETTEGIALDIQSYLLKCHKDQEHFLFGLFNINSVKIEKVGPLFDNYHGWNVLYEIASKEDMCFVPEKWDFTL